MVHSYDPSPDSSTALLTVHRPKQTSSYDRNALVDPVQRDGSPDDPSAIPLHNTRYATGELNGRSPRARASHGRQTSEALSSAASPGASTTASTSSDSRVGRSMSLFRSKSRRHTHSKVVTQSTLPPVPQLPIPQHTGKDTSRFLTLDDVILIRICRYFDIDNLLKFAHVSQRCRAMTARSLQLILQRTVLKATLCQERKALFSLEFIFQHMDPSSLCAVFRASQLKSRRYFENSALARPQVQALTLVTPDGLHHPLFTLAGFHPESMTGRDVDRAATLLSRPFQLDIKDKGFYRVSSSTSFMIDTPFFPAQPLLDRLTPFALDSHAGHAQPVWEMIYKVDRQLPNYPARMQQHQEKLQSARLNSHGGSGTLPAMPSSPTRSIASIQSRTSISSDGPVPASPTTPKKRSPLSRKMADATAPLSSPGSNGSGPFVASGLPSVTKPFAPLPDIQTGPSLHAVVPAVKDDGAKLGRRPTVVRPPPEGWGPLPPVAPPMLPNLSHQLGTRTVPGGGVVGGGGGAASVVPLAHGGLCTSSVTPLSGSHMPLEPSCLEPELAEETERFLTLLFIQFPIQTLFPHVAMHAPKKYTGGLVGKIGRSLTLKKH
ncbi:hypothetical protein DFQ27_008755 [Actinomortierella ambigua]|uniref:F-box domain-containing protein n=1 Tax=Actinomortierella ambigua TaxID=1343610 RepID=A0A9P6UBA0_9FUNG|nr:hypothetical protein DFQ27_008755 [Actinomortierella ambigua]